MYLMICCQSKLTRNKFLKKLCRLWVDLASVPLPATAIGLYKINPLLPEDTGGMPEGQHL